MNSTAQIAKHFREVHFGGNWTWSNLKDSLEGVTWQQATTQVYSFNTIAALVYHINYYVSAVLAVLQEKPLNSSDKYSFALPPIQSQEDWEKLLNKTWTDAGTFASLVEKLPDSKLGETFADIKYGNYFRNLHGVIEHTHYHLGQIVLIKKILLQTEPVISVMLAVADAPAAAAWYKKALGATELWSLGSVAGLQIAGARFFLGEPEKNGWESPEKLGITSARVEVFCDDPDEFIARAVQAGANGSIDKIKNHEAPWGIHRQGGFIDPFGHIWLVGDRSPLNSYS